MKKTFLTLSFLLSILLLSNVLLSNNEIALIIGNESYPDKELENPINDANSLSKVLESYGYEVHKMNNVNKEEFYEILKKVSERLEELGPDSTILFYFAGHGYQFEKENYLLPVEVKMNQKSRLIEKSINSKEIFKFFSKAGKKIVILDVCRNEILQSKFPELITSGETKIPPNTLLAFSTQNGELAIDSGEYRGIYAQALVHNLRSSGPELPINEVFNQTRKEVVQKSYGFQRPLEISTLEEEVYFKRRETKLPPDRYFYGLELWTLSCQLSFGNNRFLRQIQIDPAQNQIRSRLKLDKGKTYKNWSQWTYFSMDKEKNYFWNWELKFPQDSSISLIEENSFFRSGNFLYSQLTTSENSKKYSSISFCNLIPNPPEQMDWKSYFSEHDIAPKEKVDLGKIKRNILENRSRNNRPLDFFIMNGLENLSLDKQAHFLGVLFKNGKINTHSCPIQGKCNFHLEINHRKAYDLLASSLSNGNLSAALDLSFYYKEGIIVNRDISIAYDLAKLSFLGNRLDYWVEINKWGQEFLNNKGKYGLKLDGRIGPKTCRSVASHFNWDPAIYRCGDVFLKNTLIRLTL